MRMCVGKAQPSAAGERDMILEAGRCWCAARRDRSAVQPCLVRTLAPFACEILAPVFDALFSNFEACLGRPMIPGYQQHLTQDEMDLVALLERSMSPLARFPESSLQIVLRVALASTRIMVAFSLGQWPYATNSRF